MFEAIFQSAKYNGEILLNNQKIKKSQISYLETENYFYPYITGNEYLDYFSSVDKIKFDELTSKFNLPLKKYVQNYSSGMKKKLALIGMLMLNKPVNILDEPFNGVDFEGVHILYDIILELKSENKVVIISSHIIETLFHTCDKIGILENGRIERIYDKNQFDELINFKFGN